MTEEQKTKFLANVVKQAQSQGQKVDVKEMMKIGLCICAEQHARLKGSRDKMECRIELRPTDDASGSLPGSWRDILTIDGHS